MAKGKEKDMSTDWSDYTLHEQGYWDDEYRYQESLEDVQQRQRTPRTPVPDILSTNDSSRQSNLVITPTNELHGTGVLDATHYSHSTETIHPATYAFQVDETSLGQETGHSFLASPNSISLHSLSTFATPSDVMPTQYPDEALYPSIPGPSTSANLAYNTENQSLGNNDGTSINTVNLQSLSLKDTPEHGSYIPLQSEVPLGQLQQPKHIQPASGGQNHEKLDDRYRVVPPNKQKSFWRAGRVFMMLWTEPAGSSPAGEEGKTRNGTHYSTIYLGGDAYSEIRRFVVIKDGWGSCICSPIQTYNKQGTLKPNLPEPSQHTIIYTGNDVPYEKWYRTEGGEVVQEILTKDPIRVVSEQHAEEGRLHPASRLNYSKVYTVEKNVRVLNIGVVHVNSMVSLESNSIVRSGDAPPEPPQRHPPRSGRGGDFKGENLKKGPGGSHSKTSSGGGSRSHKPRENTKDARHYSSKKKGNGEFLP